LAILSFIGNVIPISGGKISVQTLRGYNLVKGYDPGRPFYLEEKGDMIRTIIIGYPILLVVPSILLIYFGSRFIKRRNRARNDLSGLLTNQEEIDVNLLSKKYKLKPKTIDKVIAQLKK